jgi:hypothetical protein
MRFLLLLWLAAGCTLVCSNQKESCPVGRASPAFSHECYSNAECPGGSVCWNGSCISQGQPPNASIAQR